MHCIPGQEPVVLLILRVFGDVSYPAMKIFKVYQIISRILRITGRSLILYYVNNVLLLQFIHLQNSSIIPEMIHITDV
jgi:hypothetical protein